MVDHAFIFEETAVSPADHMRKIFKAQLLIFRLYPSSALYSSPTLQKGKPGSATAAIG